MSDFDRTAEAFVDMAHSIVWCSVATVDGRGRPRSRVLHPIWVWDGVELVGWVATAPTETKRSHLEASPFVSATYWAPNQDTCTAECEATWGFDIETRQMIWDLLANAPAPVGYDPSIIPGWDEPSSPAFAALRLSPWRLRVFPGTFLLKGEGEVLTWSRE